MNASSSSPSRRSFFKTATLATAALAFPHAAYPQQAASRLHTGGRRLNIGLIGNGGRGVNTIRDFLQLDENIAFCDVDPKRLNSGATLAGERFPKARRYQDYRQMFEQEKELDAVVVTTPDHMHAPISLLAMSRGLHVFCEKPLARTIGEARLMRDAARKSGVVTQMGTQGSASHSVRRAVEVIQGGALGTVREIHIWCDRTPTFPSEKKPVAKPEGLDWDIWLGVTAERPFDHRICPFHWRWWTDYGSGPLGDMGCHLTNSVFRALDLAEPAEIDVKLGDIQAPGMFPRGTVITYQFAERNGRAPLKMIWYDGGRQPEAALLEHYGIPQTFKKINSTEKLIIGDKGVLYGDVYFKLNGDERFLGTMKHEACRAIPETIPRAAEQGTLGHYREWAEACKGNGSTYAGFDIGAAQSEMVLLGALAVQLGKKISWDPATMTVPGEPKAAGLITPTYRPGFTV